MFFMSGMVFIESMVLMKSMAGTVPTITFIEFYEENEFDKENVYAIEHDFNV